MMVVTEMSNHRVDNVKASTQKCQYRRERSCMCIVDIGIAKWDFLGEISYLIYLLISVSHSEMFPLLINKLQLTEFCLNLLENSTEALLHAKEAS